MIRAGAVVAGIFLLGACARGPAGPRGPVVSPTGIVYELGVPPRETRFSQTAALYLRAAEDDRALQLALEGVETDPGNPIHYFLAGVAHARLHQYTEADRALSEAQRIYPAYELEVEPERLAAWAEAFNRGSEAYADGADEAAIEAWRGAVRMYRLRPEAHRNLATLLYQEGMLEEATDVYQDLLVGLGEVPATRFLSEDEVSARAEARGDTEARLADLLLLTNRFAAAEPLLRKRLEADPDNVKLRQDLATALVGLDRLDEARVIYDSLLSERGLAENELYNLGVAFFRSGAADQAAEAFRRLTEVRPESRDAWFNYANALLAASDWAGLVRISDRLIEVDPLGESSALLVARGHLEAGDEQGALAQLQRIDGVPVHLANLLLQSAGSTTTLQGRMVGNGAEPGMPLQLRFYFYGDAGAAQADTILAAPPPGEADTFEISVRIRATAYRYEVVRDELPSGG